MLSFNISLPFSQVSVTSLTSSIISNGRRTNSPLLWSHRPISGWDEKFWFERSRYQVRVLSSVSIFCNHFFPHSIHGFAQQAMNAEFRMHLRAHEQMPRIIGTLMDVPKDANLAMLTAALMFIYNQDHLTMDINSNALSLLLSLVDSWDESHRWVVNPDHHDKVRLLIEEMKSRGRAKHLELSQISVCSFEKWWFNCNWFAYYSFTDWQIGHRNYSQYYFEANRRLD